MQDYAELIIEADADGDGSTETGVFQMQANIEIAAGVRTGELLGGAGATINSVIFDNPNEGVYLNLGGGVRFTEITFTGWEGSNLQWGNDSSQTKTQASATGQDPQTQVDVLTRYMAESEIDSRNPATLSYGEYSSSGIYSSLDVVIEEPRLTRPTEDRSSSFDGSIVCLNAANVNNVLDAAVERAK